MKLTRVLGATLVAATLALVPAAAGAATKTHVDPSGDVREYNPESNDPNDPGVPAPTHGNGDIRTIRVTHGPSNIRIRLTFASLTHAGFANFHEFRLQTPRYNRFLEVSAFRGHWRGDHTLLSPKGKVKCEGLRHTIDYVNDKLVVVIPRSCLDTPRWVRVGAGTGTVETDSSTGDSHLYFDDARSTGGSIKLGLGPRVASS